MQTYSAATAVPLADIVHYDRILANALANATDITGL